MSCLICRTLLNSKGPSLCSIDKGPFRICEKDLFYLLAVNLSTYLATILMVDCYP